MQRRYYVYILSNTHHTVLYTGVTGDLIRRIWQHREKEIAGFTSQYGIVKLIYFEEYNDPMRAIEREKQIKSWSRRKKVGLVNESNPSWSDLYPSLIDE